MRESHLRWFGRVQRRSIILPVWKSDLIEVMRTKRGRGRPIITLVEVKRTC
jgi:hypothetical protein